MTYKIAVCDDSSEDINYVTNLTRQWAQKHHHTVQISEFTSGENFLFFYEEEKDFDILLLDIEMGEMDGVTMAKKIRRDNDSVQIVFITGYSDYIEEGYDVAALHYLMKPVKEEKFFQVLDRAVEKLQKNEQVLILETGGGVVRVPVYQIRYVEVRGNYVTIHGKEEFTVKMSLGEVEKLLDERFYRAGRSVIVNLTCISRVTKKDIILDDGSDIPLPRGAYERVNKAIICME